MSVETETRSPRNQALLLGGIFAVVLALLAIGYFLFLRTEYVLLAQDLRPAEASAIVAELDKRKASYRLRDGGATILVPESEANATRVAIAGSDAASRGQIGFELFNKSDMGLTNFAQKINFQRALQGELVRTITAMEGVESARVHLALPEKALFRGDRAEPKAAVAVTMKVGQVADAARVAGIQQLVAAAVPDLPQGKVVVLDAAGRVISPAAAATDTALDRPADMEERTAVENYYRARARGAIERRMPGMRFGLRVLAFPVTGAAETETAAPQGWTPTGEGDARNFRLRVVFISEAALNPEDQQAVRDAVGQAMGLNNAAGDSLLFETGPIDPVTAAVPAPIAAVAAPAALPPATVPSAASMPMPPLWLWIVAAILLAAVLGWRLLAPRARLSSADHDAFAQRLRRQLNLAEENGDAAA